MSTVTHESFIEVFSEFAKDSTFIIEMYLVLAEKFCPTSWDETLRVEAIRQLTAHFLECHRQQLQETVTRSVAIAEGEISSIATGLIDNKSLNQTAYGRAFLMIRAIARPPYSFGLST